VSDRDAFRAEQQSRRQFGKAKQHEKRLENATYTAAEVKVLTETAAEAGRRIGRKEAAESVAAAIAAEIEETDDLPNMYVTGMHRARWIAVNIASLASGAASDATSVPSEGPGASEPSKEDA